MRYHALHEAHSRQTLGWTATFARVIKNWRARRDVRALLAMDDYMLRDIGLQRDDLRQLLRRPLTLDTQWEAERLALLSRSSAR